MSHASAALLAVEHFNARNTSVTPQLANYLDCPVQLSPKIFDTGSYSHLASQSLVTHVLEEQVTLSQQPTENSSSSSLASICAAVGTFHDIPAADLSVLAAAMKFPLTVTRAFSMASLEATRAPYTSQIFPEVIGNSFFLAYYLLWINRTDFVAFLYTVTETGLYRRESVSIVLDENNITHKTFGYNVPGITPAVSPERSIENSLRAIKKSGYRTIVVAVEDPTQEIPQLAQPAIDLGLTNGNYLWIWFGDYDPLFDLDDPVIREFLQGSIFITPFEGYHLENGFTGESQDLFRKAWKSQTKSQVDRLNQVLPILEDQPGYFFAEDDYFATKEPEFGSGFLYDAVIATGIGACEAFENQVSVGEDIEADDFVSGIREVDFTGATGEVSFSCLYDGCILPGARNPWSVIWGVLNNYPPGTNNDPWTLSGLMYVPQISADFIFKGGLLYGVIENPDANISFSKPVSEADLTFRYLDIFPAVYADGSNAPPRLLRDPVEQNFLSDGARLLGFCLLSICGLTAIVAAVWVFMHHDNIIVRGAQPIFLYVLCFGTLVSVSGIATISFDEGHGLSEETLGRLCMATPWLVSTGHIITFGALFSKLWRINRVLQFSRRRVNIIQVAWPSAILFSAALLILGLWTGLDPLVWNRQEINADTGESIGECSFDADSCTAFIVPLLVVVVIPTALVLYMAWKTRDVADTFSESKWIFIMTLVQLEVILFAAPMVPLLREVSTNARYIGYVIIIWTFPMSALLLIIGPKVYIFYRGDRPQKPVRGELPGQVRVSGLDEPKNATDVGPHHSRSSHTPSDGAETR